MAAQSLTPQQPATTGPGPSDARSQRSGRREVLDLYLADTRQLFNSMDPAPFRQRDLDPNATAYIVDWAEDEAPAGQMLRMVLHLGCEPVSEADASIVAESVRAYFRRRAQTKRRELQHLFRVGRYSLLIAMVFLAIVIIIGESIAGLFRNDRYASLIEDSLVIGAWVALWRPLEIFLYDWWPLSAEAKLYDRLAQMDVRTVSATPTECVDVEGSAA